MGDIVFKTAIRIELRVELPNARHISSAVSSVQQRVGHEPLILVGAELLRFILVLGLEVFGND